MKKVILKVSKGIFGNDFEIEPVSFPDVSIGMTIGKQSISRAFEDTIKRIDEEQYGWYEDANSFKVSAIELVYAKLASAKGFGWIHLITLTKES